MFSHDVTVGKLASLTKRTVAILVSPTNPPGVEFYSYANVFFCLVEKHDHWSCEWKHSIHPTKRKKRICWARRNLSHILECFIECFRATGKFMSWTTRVNTLTITDYIEDLSKHNSMEIVPSSKYTFTLSYTFLDYSFLFMLFNMDDYLYEWFWSPKREFRIALSLNPQICFFTVIVLQNSSS